MNKEAFLSGYIAKQATSPMMFGVEGLRLGGDVLSAVAPYAIAAPIVLGAGAGLLHSKMTSPSKLDQESVQKALEAAELDEFMAELKRRRKQEEIDKAEADQEKEKPVARTLHI